MRMKLLSLFIFLGWLVQMFVGAAPVFGAHAELSAAIKSDNSLDVEANLALTPGAKGTHVIDLAGLDSIGSVRVEEITPSGDKSVPFAVFREGRRFEISWQPGPASTSRFRLRYTLVGIASYGALRDEVGWEIISEFQDFGFERVHATIRLPESVAEGEVQADVHSGAEVTVCKVRKEAVEIEVENLPRRSFIRVRIHLPKGLIHERILPNRFMKTTGGTLLMFFIPVVTCGGLFLVFWFRGRDPTAEPLVGDIAEPFEGMIPAVAGTIVDERVDHRDIVAGCLELAGRGFLRLELAGGHVAEPPELRVSRVKPFDVLSQCEQGIAEMFTRSGGDSEPLVLSVERCIPRAEVASVRDEVYRQAVKCGFFRANPARERAFYAVIGVIFLVVGGVFMAHSALSLGAIAWGVASLTVPIAVWIVAAKIEHPAVRWILSSVAGALLLLGLVIISGHLGQPGFTWLAKVGCGLVLSSIFFFAFAPLMPRRTAKGASEKRRLLAFKEHLQSLGPSSMKGAGFQEIFERYLPYAVVFRYRKEWVNKFAAWGVASPLWWEMKSTGEARSSASRRVLLSETREAFIQSLSILSAAVGESPAAGSGG